MTSFNDYIESRQAQIKRKQRIVAIGSAVCFMGSTVFAVVHFITNDLQPLSQPTSTAPKSVDSQLEVQEKGYELVLQREPQNQVALEGIVQTRLQMKNFQAAQKPLEQLIKLNPSRTDYQALAKQIRQKIGDRKH
jgi:hypothetical protein